MRTTLDTILAVGVKEFVCLSVTIQLQFACHKRKVAVQLFSHCYLSDKVFLTTEHIGPAFFHFSCEYYSLYGQRNAFFPFSFHI